MNTATNTNTNNNKSNTANVKDGHAHMPASADVSTLIAGKQLPDFTVSAPMTDVRGWEVYGQGNVKIGTVDRIMLDKTEKKPRYLLISLLERDGHMLLPIGLGSLDADHDRLLLNTLTPETLKAIPVLSNDIVTHDFERRVFTAVTGRNDVDTPRQWYADAVFNPKNLMRRELQTQTA